MTAVLDLSTTTWQDQAPGVWRRLTASVATDLATHSRQHGPVPWHGRGRLISTVESSGLLGRGGAGFPTWRKMAAVAAGERAVVVANGAEGEPASAKDRVLIAQAPHLVLDGLQLAAEAVGSVRAYAYVPAEVAHTVRTALGHRLSADWDRVAVTVIEAPRAFVAGEESAVVAAIEGKAALPRDTPELVVYKGVSGAPTLVQNVETLAHLALLARHGAPWFRQLGPRDEPGTFLATVGGAVATPGVYEAPYGVGLGDLLDLAGGPTERAQAVLVGGFHGAWVPVLRDVPVSRAGLSRYGATPGAGVLVALAEGACGLEESARIVDYLAAQSARQCGPCLYGLPRMADTLTRLARGERHAGLVAEVDRLAGLVTGRGACHHPDGTARFVRSTLRTFAGEVDNHLHGRCVTRTR